MTHPEVHLANKLAGISSVDQPRKGVEVVYNIVCHWPLDIRLPSFR